MAAREEQRAARDELSEELGKLMVVSPIEWPEWGAVTLEWVRELGRTLDYASRHLLPSELPTVLPVSVLDSLLLAAHKCLHREPNCVEVPVESSCKVVLVGDVHGQFHNVLNLLEIAGPPSANRLFVFNGDYVDRGAWGFETYIYLLAWKLLLPHGVFMLQGNHETKFCTTAYGFEQEVMSKFSDRAKHLYRKCLGCFERHPLAARVAGCVYMAHGGLFRQVENEPPEKQKGKSYRRLLSGRNQADKTLKLGTLDDLQKARRIVLDPSGFGKNVIPGDVLWSDPSPKNGLSYNASRGIGLFFGPDCMQEFMEKHKLKDNVFVSLICSVQYRVVRLNADDAFYELQNPKEQIQSYVFDVVRACVPKMILDDVFEQKNEIAKAVSEELQKVMGAYGYSIEQTLIVDIIPDATVRRAMNEINAAQRMRVAAMDKAEAEKLLQVKRAEGEAAAKYLNGHGIDRQRQAITEELRESVLLFSNNVPGTSSKDVMDLVLITQYFDTMKEIGATSKNTTVFLMDQVTLEI